MNPLHGRILSVASFAAMAAVGESRAQDFFRDFGASRSSGGIGPVTSAYTSPSGLRSLTPLDETEDAEKYNFALGPVRFTLAAGLGVEFNDNVTLSDANRESDFIIRPSFDIDAAWRLSELNTLRFGLGASYAKYIEHSEFDAEGILISPTSEVVLNLALGVVRFTMRDRFSYQEDPYDIAQLSNTARYRRYENQAGIRAEWAVDETFTLAGGYDHYNLWTLNDEFSSQERAIDTIFVTPTYQLNPAIRLGVNAAFSLIDFHTDERQDGRSILVGPLVEWQISECTNLYLEVGYQQLKFDGTSRFIDDFFQELTDEERALFDDDSETRSYYAKLEITNRPSDVFEHQAQFSKTAEIGFESNYYDLYHLEYSVNWKVVRDTQFGHTLFWEYYESSGDSNEEAYRFGAALGVRHNLSNSITLGLDYRFLLKDSNLRDTDYYQNLALLSVYYKF